ncbi:MAG: hypothetical protein M3320_09215, partial [Actinomycetota bacterium]|nr:hypothetical protein [Actinomycetota bacterium]
MARIACAMLLALVALTTPAQAFQTCDHSGTTVTATFGTHETGLLSQAGGEIRANGVQCDGATTANTDKIEVVGDDDAEQLTIQLAGGGFGGGVTNEPGGSDEIEIEVDFGVNVIEPEIFVEGSPNADHVTVGLQGEFPDETSAINLNANEVDGIDPDVTLPTAAAVRVDGHGGNDVLSTAGGAGTGAPDLVTALLGQAGDDDLTLGRNVPGPGNDTVRGVAGQTMTLFYASTPRPVTITLQNGSGGNWGGATDDGENPAGVDTYVGRINVILGSNTTTGGDLFNGTSHRTIFRGGNGNDTINGGDAPLDTFEGGEGIDTIHGGPGPDELYGDGGGDFLYGDAGDDMLQGRAGDDALDGGEGDDTLKEAGFAQPATANGADDHKGGPGFDELVYGEPNEPSLGRTAAVVLDLDGVADDGNATEGDNAHGDIEHVVGGLAADTLTGDGGPNVLSGLDGADTLRGGGGADALYGFRAAHPFMSDDAQLVDGGDDLDGEAGADTIFGESGSDKIEARDDTADTITCGAGNDTG